MARDLAVVAATLSFILFAFGLLIGTSQYAGQLLAWGGGVIMLLVSVVAGARAILVERLMPKGVESRRVQPGRGQSNG